MATRRLDREYWARFFAELSDTMGAELMTIEAVGKQIGSQIDASEVPAQGFVYDEATDEFQIETKDVGHLILEPREVYVKEEVNGVTAIEVVDARDIKYIVTLKSALTLPSG